jgi:uncharacterized membrane protein YgdD (TMEM256/DUF423 family)
MDRSFLFVGALINFVGVAAGAFGAHALRSRLSADMLAVFETGVRYQMYHGFAVLLVALAIRHFGSARLLLISGWSFVGGVALFSGSLYALSLTDIRILGAITPLGGVLFLLGWVCLTLFALLKPGHYEKSGRNHP